jgi:hypothetical protein
MLVRMERAGETDNPVITYRKELLEKALQAAGKPYTIKSCDFPASVSDARVRYGVNMQPYCDVIATSAGGRASRELALVPMPLYLGGNGYRVFMASQQGLAKVGKVRSLQQLGQLAIGSGNDWPDSDIMADAALQVVRDDTAYCSSCWHKSVSICSRAPSTKWAANSARSVWKMASCSSPS